MYSNYHKAICNEMKILSDIPNTMFLGQQVASEDFYNTLKDIPMNKRTELPVMEEAQLGMCIGLALEGFLPISIYQRMDFLPRACDQLVNHLDLIPFLSRGKFHSKIIIRSTIGTNKPFDVGLQHNKDLIEGFKALLKTIPIYDVKTEEDVKIAYNIARTQDTSIIIIERQELYCE